MRLLYIDNLRGYAILLVVLGHVIQYFAFPETFDNNLLFRFVYSFHMPLFFIISGLTTNLEGISKEKALDNIKKRFIQLVFPFIVWYVIAKVFVGEMPTFELFITPDSGLWFLWVLFWVSVAFQVSMIIPYYYKQKPYYYVVATYLILRYLASINYDICGIGMISSFFLYYLIGVLLGKYKCQIPHIKYSVYYTIILFVISMMLSFLWYRNTNCIPKDVPRWIFELNKLFCFDFFTAFVGSSWVILLSTNTVTSVGAEIGNKTLGIYAIHQVLIWVFIGNIYSSKLYIKIISNNNEWVLLFSSFVAILLLTLIIYNTLSLGRISKLLLGKYR